MSDGLVSLFIAVWLVFSVASPALAYLDPMTGSFLIQGLIAGAVAVLAAIRTVRERVLNLLGLQKPPPRPLTKTSEQVNASVQPIPRDAPRS